MKHLTSIGRRAAVRRAFATAAILAAALSATAADGRAQTAWFGKNKIQYKDFKWQVLRTPHFDVHFTEGYRDLAARTGVILEAGYLKLSNDFSHQISWRIPVIIYGSQSDFQQTNVTWSLLPEGVLAFSEPQRRRIVHQYTPTSTAPRMKNGGDFWLKISVPSGWPCSVVCLAMKLLLTYPS